jgi:hypothetical protein
MPASDIINVPSAHEGTAPADADTRGVDSFENVLNDSNDRIEVQPVAQKKTVKIF